MSHDDGEVIGAAAWESDVAVFILNMNVPTVVLQILPNWDMKRKISWGIEDFKMKLSDTVLLKINLFVKNGTKSHSQYQQQRQQKSNILK